MAKGGYKVADQGAMYFVSFAVMDRCFYKKRL
jgi:hypothetical protein